MGGSIVNLHLHTRRSDGGLYLTELVPRLVEEGTDVAAITDHDEVCAWSPESFDDLTRTHGGTVEVVSRGHVKYIVPGKKALHLLAGIEVSARYCDRTLHVLAFGVNPNDLGGLEEFFVQQSHEALPRLEAEVRLLREHGIPITMTDLHRETEGSHRPSNPHLATALIRKGFDPSIRTTAQSLEKYLSPGCPAYVPWNVFPKLDFVLRALVRSGGIPVLAHPEQKWDLQEVLDVFVRCCRESQFGVEACHWRLSPERTAECIALSNEYGALITAGSDFHGLPYDTGSTGHLRSIEVRHDHLEQSIEKLINRSQT